MIFPEVQHKQDSNEFHRGDISLSIQWSFHLLPAIHYRSQANEFGHLIKSGDLFSIAISINKCLLCVTLHIFNRLLVYPIEGGDNGPRFI
jgi:hypothetical protein